MHLLRLSILSAFSAAATHAETYQWTGGVPSSASASFSEPSNWTGNTVPAAGKSTRLVFRAVSSSGRVNPNQNLGNNFIPNEFSITAAAPAFQFDGQSLLLAATGEGARSRPSPRIRRRAGSSISRPDSTPSPTRVPRKPARMAPRAYSPIPPPPEGRLSTASKSNEQRVLEQ